MKKNKFSIFSILLIVFFAVFSPIKVKPANAWLEIPAVELGLAQQQIIDFIKGTMVGALKQAAIQTINKQMDSFISGGGSGGARFITDWQDYLVNAPQRKAKAYVNDYISQAFAGRGLSSSYQSAVSGSVLGASTMAEEGFGARVLGAETCTASGDSCTTPDGNPGVCASAGGDSGFTCSSSTNTPTRNYAQEMTQMVQDQVINPQPWQMTYDGDPDKMLEANNLSNLNLYVLGNMPSDIKLHASSALDSAVQNETRVASDKAKAYSGYLGNGDETGLISKPGSLIESIQANVADLPNKAMTAASTIPEVIAATVSKAISGLTQSAVAGVQRSIDQKINSVTSKATQQLNSKVNSFGPGAIYKQ